MRRTKLDELRQEYGVALGAVKILRDQIEALERAEERACIKKSRVSSANKKKMNPMDAGPKKYKPKTY